MRTALSHQYQVSRPAQTQARKLFIPGSNQAPCQQQRRRTLEIMPNGGRLPIPRSAAAFSGIAVNTHCCCPRGLLPVLVPRNSDRTRRDYTSAGALPRSEMRRGAHFPGSETTSGRGFFPAGEVRHHRCTQPSTRIVRSLRVGRLRAAHARYASTRLSAPLRAAISISRPEKSARRRDPRHLLAQPCSGATRATHR